ncbi:MAG: hypothetical protein WKF30_04380 [Pyrinomonadaceae bacterium]
MKIEVVSHDLLTFLQDLAQRTLTSRASYPREVDALSGGNLARDMSDLDIIESRGVVTLHDRRYVDDQQAFVGVELTEEGSNVLRELYSISDRDQ